MFLRVCHHPHSPQKKREVSLRPWRW
jgi:hypothetical protein